MVLSANKNNLFEKEKVSEKEKWQTFLPLIINLSLTQLLS